MVQTLSLKMTWVNRQMVGRTDGRKVKDKENLPRSHGEDRES